MNLILTSREASGEDAAKKKPVDSEKDALKSRKQMEDSRQVTNGIVYLFVILLSLKWLKRQGNPHTDEHKYVTEARFRRRSFYVQNLTDELSTAKERHLNQLGTAVLV